METKEKVGVILVFSLMVLSMVALGGASVYKHGDSISSKDYMSMVSHSEYWSSEQGQIIARLYDWQGDPITVDNCSVDIFYANKTYYIAGGITDDSLQALYGTHYYSFTTPEVEGVYEYSVQCFYGNNKMSQVSSSFHLSPALNFERVINDSVTYSIQLQNTHYNNLQINLSEIDNDLVTIMTDIGKIQVNLTDIRGDTQYIRENMVTDLNFQNNMSSLQGNQNTIIEKENQILNNITTLQQFCDSTETSGSSLCLWVGEILSKVDSINQTLQSSNEAYLIEINQTTHSTYDYLTGDRKSVV